MKWRRLLTALLAGGAASLLVTRVLWAQDPTPAAGEQSIFGLTFAQLMALISNLGLGGIVFVIWLHGIKRQTSVEALLTRYEESQQGHLQAFKDINEAYRALATDMHNTMLLNIQIQTRLVEKLEAMERTHGQR